MCYMGVNRLNLRSLDNDSSVKATFVKLKGVAGPRMFVCESTNMIATCCWFTTTNIYQEQNFTWDMLEFDDRLTDLSDLLPEISDPYTKEQILTSLADKRKIDAIKLFREYTGQGLKEAKYRMDALEVTLYNRNPITGTNE